MQEIAAINLSTTEPSSAVSAVQTTNKPPTTQSSGSHLRPKLVFYITLMPIDDIIYLKKCFNYVISFE